MNATDPRGSGPGGLVVERAGGGRALLDLTVDDPARCGLGWEAAAVDELLARTGPADEGARRAADGRAREAVAGYLAGRGAAATPDRIRLARSRRDALRLALAAVAGTRGDVLAPLPGDPTLDAHAREAGLELARYPLAYDRAWHLDHKALARRIGPRTRAVLLGNPSVPAGAMLSDDDLTAAEALCAGREVALVGDEALIDTALGPSANVLDAARCLALHVSGLSGVCGNRELGCEWIALSGPDHLVAPALARLDRELAAGGPDAASPRPEAIPPLLARREMFLGALRNRLAGNRAALATAALREAPWSLCWGGGGIWGVLRIGATEPDDVLCDLLRRDGIAVHPGSRYGLGGDEHLVVSLLPPPDVFQEALARLDRHLRAPLDR